MKMQKSCRGLTHARLLEAVAYDPETGIFVRLSGGRFGSVGKPAGCLDYKNGGLVYVSIGIGYVKYYAHDLAVFYTTGIWPSEMPDHIDGDGTNNRIANLRPSNASENCANSKTPRNNTSGYKGVSTTKDGKKFRAYITKNRRQINLGTYETATEAAQAYVMAARRIYGDFACTNR